MLSKNKIKTLTTQFVEKWDLDEVGEKQNTQKFWIEFIELLEQIYEVPGLREKLDFEKKVSLKNQSYIDVYINDLKVLIEQKSSDKDLLKDQKQSDGEVCTPYKQAKRYANELPYSENPKYIITCNFKEFLIYDQEKPKAEPYKILLKDLAKDYIRFSFLTEIKQSDTDVHLEQQLEVSVKAGELVGKLYEVLRKAYIEPDSEETLKSLNVLCVRLVFCLYAEDAGLFIKDQFYEYMKLFPVPRMRKALIELFDVLNTPEQLRDPYLEPELQAFPYVNGGLFSSDIKLEIPNFTEEIKNILLDQTSYQFDWSMISPTIFGALFESTLNSDTRRSGGMHYTSIENIHKVIDPLFLNDLQEEFNNIKTEITGKELNKAQFETLEKVLDKFNSIKTEITGKELNKTQIETLEKFLDKFNNIKTRIKGKKLNKAQIETLEKFLDKFNSIKTEITGKELNKTQIETLEKFLDKFNNIKTKGNKLSETQIKTLEKFQDKLASLIFLDPACGSGNFLTETYISLRKLENEVIQLLTNGSEWFIQNSVKVSINQFYGIEINDFAVSVAKTALWIAESQMLEETNKFLQHKEDFLPLKTYVNIVEGNALRLDWNEVIPAENLNYIMGNPPFLGYVYQNKNQKQDLELLNITSKSIDYVAGWYYKACDYMKNTNILSAFVSTNSITQGEQVNNIWKYLYDTYQVDIKFAYRTFKWNSDANNKALVFCVIVGFGLFESDSKKIFDKDMTLFCEKISPYLRNSDIVFLDNRTKPICDVPKMGRGSQPTDDGNFLMNEDEYRDFKDKYPQLTHLVKKYLGSKEFINGGHRYCFWLEKANPNDFRNCSYIMDRINNIREFRLKSSKVATRRKAETPTLFDENHQPKADFIVIPEASSERRLYVPIGFLNANTICSNGLRLIPNASLFHFGILNSSIHMAWVRAVAGRLGLSYRYSKDIVYNNFIWCNPTEEQRIKIEETAQGILDARALYPDCSLAGLYDELTMPIELRKAHQANDRAVIAAYKFKKDITEDEIVAELFKLYEKKIKELDK